MDTRPANNIYTVEEAEKKIKAFKGLRNKIDDTKEDKDRKKALKKIIDDQIEIEKQLAPVLNPLAEFYTVSDELVRKICELQDKVKEFNTFEESNFDSGALLNELFDEYTARVTDLEARLKQIQTLRAKQEQAYAKAKSLFDKNKAYAKLLDQELNVVLAVYDEENAILIKTLRAMNKSRAWDSTLQPVAEKVLEKVEERKRDDGKPLSVKDVVMLLIETEKAINKVTSSEKAKREGKEITLTPPLTPAMAAHLKEHNLAEPKLVIKSEKLVEAYRKEALSIEAAGGKAKLLPFLIMLLEKSKEFEDKDHRTIRESLTQHIGKRSKVVRHYETMMEKYDTWCPEMIKTYIKVVTGTRAGYEMDIQEREKIKAAQAKALRQQTQFSTPSAPPSAVVAAAAIGATPARRISPGKA